jgi:hypothetical protein
MRKNPVVQKGDEGSPLGFAAPLAALVLALAVSGCGRNGGDVPGGFVPPGTTGQDNLLTVEVVKDSTRGPATPVVQVMVYDRTVADGYRLYRQVGDGGYAPATEYPGDFSGTYNEGYETYSLTDRDWQPAATRNYLGRGTVAGQESGLSPRTNTATVPSGEVDDLLPGGFLTVCPIDTSATDSLPLMVWEPVPGAVRYLIRIVRTDARVFFLGMTPADGSTSYQLASGAGMVFQEQPLSRSGFFWAVQALDASSRVIARSNRQIFVFDPEEAEPPCTP